jgi:phospholipid/cholesterol/gamma-HCH transport system permease protein
MNDEVANQSDTQVHFELVQEGDGRYILVLEGQLSEGSTPVLWQELERKLASMQVSALKIEAGGLTYCDTAGASLLYFLNTGQMTHGAQVTLSGLKPKLQKILQSFSMEEYQVLQSQQQAKPSVAEDVGVTVTGAMYDLQQMVAFVGEVVSGLYATLFHPQQIRWREVLRIIEIAGVNALPIVSLISLLVGLIIAFEAAQPLAQFGAQIYVVNMIGLVMVRELGPVMTAIMLAGRSGSSFAAEIGTMKVNEELNALETMGLDPVRFLVVQRIIASLLLTPLLTIYSMFTGVLGGVPGNAGTRFFSADDLQAIGVQCAYQGYRFRDT